MNEEFPVSASHKLALITSLPFVHTARRYYRLDGLVSSLDWSRRRGNALVLVCREEGQTVLSRGSKSRNKVSVGEPAEGSLTFYGGPDLRVLRSVLRDAELSRSGRRLYVTEREIMELTVHICATCASERACSSALLSVGVSLECRRRRVRALTRERERR